MAEATFQTFLLPFGRPSQHSALTACRHTVSGSISLPFRGAFHLSLTILVHYRSPRVFSLGRWSSQLPTGFLVSRGTQEIQQKSAAFSPTGLSPSLAGLSSRLRLTHDFVTSSVLPSGPAGSYNPATTTAWTYHVSAVWAVPISLAATQGIAFAFYSSGYLDGSVLPLTFAGLLQPEGLHPAMTEHNSRQVSPFGYLRVEACSRLTAAFRSLPRPSSALGTKASTARPS